MILPPLDVYKLAFPWTVYLKLIFLTRPPAILKKTVKVVYINGYLMYNDS